MFRKACLWLVIALCFAAAAPGASAEEKVYINGIDANFPPFAFVDKNGVPDGFDVKALDWIAREMKFKVKHQPQDWDSIVPSLKARKIDIVASGMSITDQRKKEVHFTNPYWNIQQVLVAKRDSALTPQMALAGNSKIGVQRGTTEAKWMDENLIKKGKKFTLVQYDSAPLAIEDVLNGRIAAAAMDDAPAKDAVNKKKAVKIIGTFGMPDETFGYAVRKDDAELLKKLNEGLKRLQKSPYWKELVATYIEKKK